jgi:hypothetical protein
MCVNRNHPVMHWFAQAQKGFRVFFTIKRISWIFYVLMFPDVGWCCTKNDFLFNLVRNTIFGRPSAKNGEAKRPPLPDYCADVFY